MAAIARASVSTQAVAGRAERATPQLDAQMRTCRAQLADWVTCPSAKTPQGKAKIEQISAKLNSIKDEIKKTESSPPGLASATSSAPSDSSRQAEKPATYLSAPSRVGIGLDIYA